MARDAHAEAMIAVVGLLCAMGGPILAAVLSIALG